MQIASVAFLHLVGADYCICLNLARASHPVIQGIEDEHNAYFNRIIVYNTV